MGTDASRLGLRTRLADLAETGQGELRSVVGEFRRSEVLLAVVDSSLLSAEAGGVRWLFAFTDDAALERFARARGEPVPEALPVYGARLLDQVLPDAAKAGWGGGGPVPVGIAVDAGSPAGLVLPPVRGIVPDTAALDAEGLGADGPGAERATGAQGATGAAAPPAAGAAHAAEAGV